MSTGTENLTEEQAQQYWKELDAGTASTPAADESDDDKAPATAPAAAPAEPVEEEDPYAGLSQAQKNKMIGLEQMVSQQSTRLRNVEGHIGGLKSQLSAQQQAAQGATAPTSRELTAATGSPEAMKALQENYPEFASAIESYVSETTQALRNELAARSNAPAGLSRQEVDAMLNEHTVEVLHPGWKQTVQQPEFIGWLRQQPPEVQKLAASDLAADAVSLLDGYKKPTAAQEKRNSRLESQASIPSGRAAGSKGGKPVEEMTDAEYWDYLERTEKKGK